MLLSDLTESLAEQIELADKKAELDKYMSTLPAEYNNKQIKDILGYWFLNDSHFNSKDLYHGKLSDVLKARAPINPQDLMRSAMIWYIHKGRDDIVNYLKKFANTKAEPAGPRLTNVDPLGAGHSQSIKKFDVATRNELEAMDQKELAQYEKDIESYRRWFRERNNVLKREKGPMRFGQTEINDYLQPVDPPEYKRVVQDIAQEKLRRRNAPQTANSEEYTAEVVGIEGNYVLCYTKLGETQYYFLADEDVMIQLHDENADEDDYGDPIEYDDEDYDISETRNAVISLNKSDILGFVSIGPNGIQIKSKKNIPEYKSALQHFIKQGEVKGLKIVNRDGRKVLTRAA